MKLFLELNVFNVITEFDSVLQKYEKQNNPLGAFTYLFQQLSVLFQQENFLKLQKTCSLTGAGCSREFKKEIQAAKSSDDILNVLDDFKIYCNWLNTEYLKMIVINAGMPNAEKLIVSFEKRFYSKQVSDVKKYIRSTYFDPHTVEFVTMKINENGENLTVQKLTDYCRELETNMGLATGSITPVGPGKSGCLLLVCAMPLHCSLHAYEMAKLNSFKFRKSHIQFVHIESCQKIFSFPYFVTMENLPVISKGKFLHVTVLTTITYNFVFTV